MVITIKASGHTNEDHRATGETSSGRVRLVDESDSDDNCQGLHVMVNFTLKDAGSIKPNLQCSDHNS
jgi:hypothetical protein